MHRNILIDTFNDTNKERRCVFLARHSAAEMLGRPIDTFHFLDFKGQPLLPLNGDIIITTEDMTDRKVIGCADNTFVGPPYNGLQAKDLICAAEENPFSPRLPL